MIGNSNEHWHRVVSFNVGKHRSVRGWSKYMNAAALSRREFCEFIDVSNRELHKGYGYGPFRSRASSPVSHARGWVVRMRESECFA